MKLIGILEKRISDKHYDKAVVTWLYNTANDIITKASAHLEYVRNVLDEFDKHNAEHSEKVLEIMENLLGNHAERLSSYDIFSLIAVAYLHDCGMAVSDYEVNVMKLVEDGGFDGKKVCKKAEARTIIEKNKGVIFKTDRDAGDIKKWLFYPGSEHKLYDYYAQLLIDYQTFRNGKKDTIQNSKDRNQTNKELRVDYIRRTHTERIEKYIETWGEKEIANLNENKPQGKHLFNNIAKACRSHGEDEGYIRKLDKTASYIEAETSNLQFVAMMLRIGDIAHFTYDRAPAVLRALHHFDSDYSYEQWRIKTDTGVNIPIRNGAIICNAYCENPKDYYNLSTYVDYIDKELELYNRLRFDGSWKESYPAMPKKVERKGLRYNDELFTPVPNLRFTLEQNRILDLLMGAELYSDEYACLRELYQNSLDACRCQMAIRNTEGYIEFGLETDENGNKYVYCLDNGKGMSKHIIENYLLKIGSSYYKSAEFYQSQANTGNTFTPTSQFGIGILSCFMIGDRIEITTHEEKSKDGYVSCVMENIHECFYYKPTSQDDTDVIESQGTSGTLIKVFLNQKYKEKMSNEYLDNIGYWLWKEEETYRKEKDEEDHSNHLYFILDGFIKLVPTDIRLIVKFSDGNTEKIYDKPQPMGEGIWAIPNNKNNRNHIERIEKNDCLSLDAEHDGIRYKSYIVLPKEEGADTSASYALFGRKAYCVDGIKVDDSFVKGDMLKTTERYNLGGILCFMGSERPQLSISREKIVNYEPDKYEEKIKELLYKICNQAIDKIADHISRNHIPLYSTLYYNEIWKAFFSKFEDMPYEMAEQNLFNRESVKDLPFPFSDGFTSSQITLGNFIGETLVLENYSMYRSFSLMGLPDKWYQIITNRINSSKSISLDGTRVLMNGNEPTSEKHLVPSKDGLFQDYDIVTSLFPFISHSLYSVIKYRGILFKLYSYAESFLRILLGMDENLYEYESRKVIGRMIYNAERRERPTDLFVFLSKFINDNRSFFLARFDNGRDYIRYCEGSGNNILFMIYHPISKNLLKRSYHLRYLNTYFSAYEGMSVVLFGNDFYVVPGRWSRQELVDKIPYDVWNRLSHKRYRFTDGTLILRKQKRTS